MKPILHIAAVVAAVIAIALLTDSWRSARRDADQLNATITSQGTAIRQAEAREKQRDAQLASALAVVAAQKRAVQTPREAAKAIPAVLPPLPLPISIHIPDLSPSFHAPYIDHTDLEPATITVPQADLKPLYDALQDCRANVIENDTLKNNLADQQSRIVALTKQRDSAIVLARNGTFWTRLKRSTKWFVIGIAIGAATASAAH